MHSSRSHDAVIRVYDDAGSVLDGHKHKGDFNSERYRVKTKNRHTVKHDGLMFRLVDQL